MKCLFNISSNSSVSHQPVVLCELSHYHFSLAVVDASTQTLQQLRYYEPAGPLTAEQVSEVLNASGIDWPHIHKLVVCSAFPDLAVVPQTLFKKEQAAAYLTTTNTQPGDPVFFDEETGEEVVLVYSLPQTILSAVQSKATAEVIQVFTPVLQSPVVHDMQDVIVLDFTPKEFRVLVRKEGQLLLAQTYFYTAPADVLYYLLAICRQYDLSQTETTVVLSGLLDKKSELYKELHQYFVQVQFAETGANWIANSEHPQHFFSSLYNLAACVL